MKLHKILHKVTKSVLFEKESLSTKMCLVIAVQEDSNLRYADLRDADLGGANLRDANLRYANLRYANLGGADLRGADLIDADLGGANLRYADLGGANLRDANLGYANLRYANLGGADLRDADLGGADLRDAKGIVRLDWEGFPLCIQNESSQIGCEYRENTEWLEMPKEKAVKLGIKGDHYEKYRAILKLGISLL